MTAPRIELRAMTAREIEVFKFDGWAFDARWSVDGIEHGWRDYIERPTPKMLAGVLAASSAAIMRSLRGLP